MTDEEYADEMAKMTERMAAELAPVMMGILAKYTAKGRFHPNNVLQGLNGTLMCIAIANMKLRKLTTKEQFLEDVGPLWDGVVVEPSIVDAKPKGSN